MILLNIDANAKTVKGQAKGYLTAILYLQPNKRVCPHSSNECMKDCIVKTGRGQMPTVQKARKLRTEFFEQFPQAFIWQLKEELRSFFLKAEYLNLKPCVRLNGTSDIDWGKIPNFDFAEFPDIQFYDYTKDFHKLLDNRAENYHLTFSYSGNNKNQCQTAVELGFNVAMVFHNPPKGPGYINGEHNDLRFLDVQGGMIVALQAKGTDKVNDFFQVARGWEKNGLMRV